MQYKPIHYFACCRTMQELNEGMGNTPYVFEDIVEARKKATVSVNKQLIQQIPTFHQEVHVLHTYISSHK